VARGLEAVRERERRVDGGEPGAVVHQHAHGDRLLAGGAEPSVPSLSPNGRAPYDVRAGAIFSSRDTLFTSGSLGRYCTTINSLPEAEAKP